MEKQRELSRFATGSCALSLRAAIIFQQYVTFHTLLQ